MIQYVQRYCSSYLCEVSCVRHKSVGVAQVGRNERKFKSQVRDRFCSDTVARCLIISKDLKSDVVHLWLS